MRVACQILQHVFGSSKRSPYLDHPFWFLETAYETVKGFGPLQRLQFSGQAQLLTSEGDGEQGEKLPPKHPSEYGARKKEAFSAVDPG